MASELCTREIGFFFLGKQKICAECALTAKNEEAVKHVRWCRPVRRTEGKAFTFGFVMKKKNTHKKGRSQQQISNEKKDNTKKNKRGERERKNIQTRRCNLKTAGTVRYSILVDRELRTHTQTHTQHWQQQQIGGIELHNLERGHRGMVLSLSAKRATQPNTLCRMVYSWAPPAPPTVSLLTVRSRLQVSITLILPFFLFFFLLFFSRQLDF